MPSFFTNDYQTLIGHLVEARKKSGITQMQLAQAMRIEQTLVSRIERCERRIDAVEFLHICALLGVSTDEIYGHLKPRFAVLQPATK
ncbi:helix-turn-helix domain-containing protein [Erwinia sp. OPT-41]|uniref:Helix-turn-helix domain-containing protein n=1 Tax=Erwinia plantamica TaxID=3237104 RepID=A0ABW7CM68_9GAMM